MSVGTADGEMYFHHDALGSVSALSDADGELLRRFDYEPFGTLRASTEAVPGAPSTDMMFGGEQYDSETGLYYLRARYYDPGLGRFTQTDPLAPSLTDPFVSAYAYANNQPTSLVDPSGLRAAAAAAARQAAGAQGTFASIATKVLDGEWDQITIDEFQSALSVVGMVPGIGDAVDVVNGIMYAARGKWSEAAWSLAAVVPVVGSAVAVRGVLKYGDEAIDAGRTLMRGGDEVFEAARGATRTADFASDVRRIGDNTFDNVIHNLPTTRTTGGRAGFWAERLKGDRGALDISEIRISRSRYPESARHIDDAHAAGHPTELTIDRGGAAARRAESMRGSPRQPGLDRDEYPPAMFAEGGEGSSVRGIDPSDNRGAGSSIGNQCRGLPDGSIVRIVIGC